MVAHCIITGDDFVDDGSLQISETIDKVIANRSNAKVTSVDVDCASPMKVVTL